MARHRVGEYMVEVLHRQDKTGKVNVAVFVFLKGVFVEQAEFGFNGFNSAELRRRLPSLEGFAVPRLKAVIEDAREWPKGGADKKPEPTKRKRRNRRKAR